LLLARTGQPYQGSSAIHECGSMNTSATRRWGYLLLSRNCSWIPPWLFGPWLLLSRLVGRRREETTSQARIRFPPTPQPPLSPHRHAKQQSTGTNATTVLNEWSVLFFLCARDRRVGVALTVGGSFPSSGSRTGFDGRSPKTSVVAFWQRGCNFFPAPTTVSTVRFRDG
jgi:hypothetical protein